MKVRRATSQLVRAGVMLLALTHLWGCAPLTLGIANLPARFGPETRLAPVQYGEHPRQRLEVFLPGGTATATRPVVVFFHGGSWSRGKPEDYRFVGHALARAGFVAVLAGYRLYPDVRFPDFVADAAAAIAWSHTHAGDWCGDAGRLFVAGHSAGAHVAMLVALDQRWLGTADAAGAIRGAIGLSGPYDFLPLDSSLLRAIFGAALPLSDTQPVRFVSAAAPPVLLVHGRGDAIVRPGNSERLAAALEAEGTAVTLRLYDDLGHGDTIAAFSPLRRGLAPVLEEIRTFIDSAGGATPQLACAQRD